MPKRGRDEKNLADETSQNDWERHPVFAPPPLGQEHTAKRTMANNHSDTEKRLWEAADEFRANSELKSSEYAVPVLGFESEQDI